MKAQLQCMNTTHDSIALGALSQVNRYSLLQLTCAIRKDHLKSYFTIERRLFALLWLLLILDEAKT